MNWYAGVALLFWWGLWFYPFLFRAPHFQKRPSITAIGPTRVGLLFECLGVLVALVFRDIPVEWWRAAVAGAFAIVACIIGWTSVTHLGKQFRVHAGLYEDHELVRTGPYGVVRHPIYTSFLCMLLATIFTMTRWEWGIAAIVLFIIGTEIRVHTEDKLLKGRFGPQFDAYRNQVPAYIPFVR